MHRLRARTAAVAVQPAAVAAAPSKSQRKRDMHALQALGAQLAGLGQERLAAIDLPERLREAIAALPGIGAREARRRQLQLIGRLMREVDADRVRAQIDDTGAGARAAVARMHRCERWRERLIADDAALTEFVREHPRADVQSLRSLIRSARREMAAGSAAHGARALYRALHGLLLQETAANESPAHASR